MQDHQHLSSVAAARDSSCLVVFVLLSVLPTHVTLAGWVLFSVAEAPAARRKLALLEAHVHCTSPHFTTFAGQFISGKVAVPTHCFRAISDITPDCTSRTALLSKGPNCWPSHQNPWLQIAARTALYLIETSSH